MVPFFILVSVYTWCPFGGTRNIHPTSYRVRVHLESPAFLRCTCAGTQASGGALEGGGGWLVGSLEFGV